jgi:hypothetical protein
MVGIAADRRHYWCRECRSLIFANGSKMLAAAKPSAWLASPTAKDSKLARDLLFLGPRRGGGGRCDQCNLCRGNHHHARHRRSSPHRRARHLLLGTVRARYLRVAVVHRHDCGDLYLPNRSGSVRVVGFVTSGFILVAGQWAFFHRTLPHRPPYHWATIRDSGRTRRVSCDPYPCTPWHSRGMVANVVRGAWRHRCRGHRLGACVDADQPRPQTESFTQHSSTAE